MQFSRHQPSSVRHQGGWETHFQNLKMMKILCRWLWMLMDGINKNQICSEEMMKLIRKDSEEFEELHVNNCFVFSIQRH